MKKQAAGAIPDDFGFDLDDFDNGYNKANNSYYDDFIKSHEYINKQKRNSFKKGLKWGTGGTLGALGAALIAKQYYDKKKKNKEKPEVKKNPEIKENNKNNEISIIKIPEDSIFKMSSLDTKLDIKYHGVLQFKLMEKQAGVSNFFKKIVQAKRSIKPAIEGTKAVFRAKSLGAFKPVYSKTKQVMEQARAKGVQDVVNSAIRGSAVKHYTKTRLKYLEKAMKNNPYDPKIKSEYERLKRLNSIGAKTKTGRPPVPPPPPPMQFDLNKEPNMKDINKRMLIGAGIAGTGGFLAGYAARKSFDNKVDEELRKRQSASNGRIINFL